MDIATLLTRLDQLEHAMADLYLWLSGVFEDDHEVSRLFARLHTQELAHANLVQYERRLVRSDPDTFSSVDLDAGPVEEVMGWIREFRSAAAPPVLKEALLFSMRVESHAAEHLHRKAVAASNRTLCAMVAQLAEADRQHFETLRDFVASHPHLLE